MSYPDIIVSGAGTSAFNGTYYDTGNLLNGRPIYEDGANHQIKSLTSVWVIAQIVPPVIAYRSGVSDVPDTPDLVAAWFVQGAPGVAPAPTVTAASSSQNLTLTCAAGSYSLAGVACTLTYTPAAQNLTLSCGAGSLALTGSACTLSVKRNYVLSCESGGSYAVTGTSASLTKNLVMACESAPDMTIMVVAGAGSAFVNETCTYKGVIDGKPYYASNYVDISRVTIKWVTSTLTWVIAREDIFGGFTSFYQSHEDVATPDLVTIWWVSNGALPLPTVTSSPATSYALTGSSVTLTKSLVLSCETGSYTLTGTDISFGNTKAYELVCGAGSYALTGSDVSFVIARDYSLSMGAGSYSLTGTDCTLSVIHTYSFSCGAGSYAITGTNAALTSARSLACNSGAYVLTGLEADLFKRLVMPCGNGSYALTGSPATINSARTFALGMGSYVLVGTDAGLFILTSTPECRTYFIDAENRTWLIDSEDRTRVIDAENRTLEVRCH